MADNILEKLLKPGPRGRLWQVLAVILVMAFMVGVVSAGKYYNQAGEWLKGKTGNTVALPYIEEIPFRLGLDLVGGTHLVYDANMSEIPPEDQASALEGVRDVIERRVNTFGVSEPVIQTSISGGQYRVIVELAGIKDVEEAINMIGETPLLEFKEQSQVERELTEEERNALEQANKAAETGAEDILGKALSGGDLAALVEDLPAGEAQEQSGDLGWVTAEEYPELIPEVESLEPGTVVPDIIETSQGYNVLKLEDKREKANPFVDNEAEMQINASHILICHNQSENCSADRTKEEAYAEIKRIKEQAVPENFEELAQQYSDEPGSEQTGGDLGWFGRGAMVAPFETAVFEQEVGTVSYVVESKFGYHIIHKKAERPIVEYRLTRAFLPKTTEADITGAQTEWKNTELTGKQLEGANVQFDPNDGTPEVALEFNDEGDRLFEEITGRNVGRPVAIYLDGEPISVPTVNEKITGGRAVISGKFNIPEAKQLAQRLNAGALPVPIDLVSQQTVGASLGSISLYSSLQAGLWGLLIVVAFMLLFYRIPGIIASLSLLIYGGIVLAVFKALPLWLAFILIALMIILLLNTFNELGLLNSTLVFTIVLLGVVIFYFAHTPITLTLAGIAGFILSIGMAVDANVLIFERMREEIKNGKPLTIAVEDGFKRAWPSIRDGNISTILTCVILMTFGTGFIQGFGTTLLIGISVSMFSAIIVTRNLLLLVVGQRLSDKTWFFGVPARKINSGK
jgi:protein-export membrane protein SecD